MYFKKSKIPWSVIFWSTNFISLIGLILPLFLMTPIVEGFTFGMFHNTISIVEFTVVYFLLGLLRILLNRYIYWKNITFLEVFKIIGFTIIVGTVMQLCIYYLLRIVTFNFFPLQTIPNMYFGGEELKIVDTVLKTFTWAFIFFTIKMIINFNAFKLEGIALEEKVKQEEINIISGRVDAVFMEKSIESIKDLVLVDINEARAALTQLSDVLRYNLTQENFEFVTIDQELIVVKNYLNLIRRQFNNDLIYNQNIPSEFLSIKVSPIKFLKIIKKVVDEDTISVTITMNAFQSDCRVEINIRNKEKNTGLKNTDLYSIFPDDENIELITKENEFMIVFLIKNVEKQELSFYE